MTKNIYKSKMQLLIKKGLAAIFCIVVCGLGKNDLPPIKRFFITFGAIS